MPFQKYPFYTIAKSESVYILINGSVYHGLVKEVIILETFIKAAQMSFLYLSIDAH